MSQILIVLLIINVIVEVLHLIFKVKVSSFKFEIPEINLKVNNQAELIPINDPVYDEHGDVKPDYQGVQQKTMDSILEEVNKIMYGEDIVEGSDK